MLQNLLRDHSAGVKLKRSPKWGKTKRIKKEAIKAEHGALICEACCRIKWMIFIHHIFPFHIFPHRELDQKNLIGLCAWCHLTLGHLRNWRSWNPDVRRDAAYLMKKIKGRMF